MATGMRHKLWATAAMTPLVLLGACGEKASEPADAGEPDAEIGGGIDGLLAQLEDGVAGRACTTDEDCGGKNARCSPGPESIVRSCTGLCTSDEQCGKGGTCVEVARLGPEPLSFCQQVCSDDSECDPALQCSQAFNAYQLVVSISELLRGADLSGAGATYTICQERSQTVQMETGAVGMACEDAEPCGGGECFRAQPWTPGGYCSGKCMQDDQCGETGACVRDVASVALGLPGMCLLKCTQDSECRESEGYGCLALPFVGGATHCVNRELLQRGLGAGFPRAAGAAPPGAEP